MNHTHQHLYLQIFTSLTAPLLWLYQVSAYYYDSEQRIS